MNCTNIDVALDDAREYLTQHDTGFIITVACLGVLSVTLLVYGERLVKPISVLIGGLGGGGAVYVITSFIDDDMSCTSRLILSTIAGVLLALIALCLFNTGILLLGAAGFATISHFVYNSLPLEDVDPPFLLLGVSGYYYLTIASSVVIGGVIAYCQKEVFIRICSSCIGGGGVGLIIFLVFDRTEIQLSSIVLLLIVVVSSLIGVCFQYIVSTRKGGSEQLHRRDTS